MSAIDIFIYFALFIIGLAIGSFFNVVAFRYNPSRSVFHHKNLGGRSHCTHCGKRLQWFELIPLVSFVIQKRKCRSCGEKLSFQYPIVELLGGLILAGIPLYFAKFYAIMEPFSFSSSLRSYYGFLILWILVFLTWLLISVIDHRHYLVPDGLNVALGVFGIIIAAIKSLPSGWLLPFHDSFLRHYELILSPTQTVWLNHFLGALIGGLFFVLLVALSRGRGMGMGDVKLAIVSGLILGWPDIGLATILAFILGGVWGALLLLGGKKTLHDKIPFAPIFILGMALTVFLGFEIVHGYLGLFNI
ncbi:MAG: prepilin peptidase [Candidatus Jorgensenbacteria bacterium]